MSLNQFEIRFKLITETIGFYCTIGFYTLLAFQRHIIFDFWIYESKDMIFVSLQMI
jgi:hypothetical protein